MSLIKRKICLIGDFAVGKTSLVSRFVHQVFSDKYLTTLGVKIDTAECHLDEGPTVKLVIWDIAGRDTFRSVDQQYLRGAAGYLLVVDGTRLATLLTARRLKQDLEQGFGNLPGLLLVNKLYLKEEWEVDLEAARELGLPVVTTSAKSGYEVDTAFHTLATKMVSS